MTNPIPPISPESPRGPRGAPRSAGKKFEEQMPVEEVEKISEAELDKRGKRAFKKGMEEEGALEEGETRSPSPFETEFYKAPVGFSDLEDSQTREEEAPAAPSMQATPAAFTTPEPSEEENLPESEQFWSEYDLPDQPLPPTQFEEKAPPQKAREVPTEKKDALFAGAKKSKAAPPSQAKRTWPEEAVPTKAQSPMKTSLPKPFSKTEKKGALPSAAQKEKPASTAKQQPQEAMPSTAFQKYSPATLSKKGDKEEEEPSFPQAPLISQPPLVGKERAKSKTKSETPTPVHPPDPLPSACQKIAEVAVAGASPFLNAQTAELYLQMVGTMVFMASSKGGISVTEVMLNSPAFQKSVFFNSTITLEKYASAPDSFNIRLVGTPEAVQAFSNNVESLSTAFTTAYNEGRLLFRVGRIDTEIASNRPLIRRKKEGGSQENLQ